MLLETKDLLANRDENLKAERSKLVKKPGMAHIWVGDDAQTAIFVRVKKNKAATLDCDYFLHNFTAADNRQLSALITGLNVRKDIHGIVLQLPLPKGNNPDELIGLIAPEKDVDGLTTNSPYSAPTPSGVIAILEHNYINPAEHRVVIIGAGRLVGAPLAKIFTSRNWPFTHITKDAQKRAKEISGHNLVIACSGVAGLITPGMVTKETIVIDASGVDADVKTLEPLVKTITPAKGGIGPLTVSYLFENLLKAATK